ncbi:MAG: hypothetical protein JWM53_4461 [bacterium]|nr:hypothetical protein [bacterium]
MKSAALVTIVALASAPAFAQSVWVAASTQKIRPSDPSGAATTATLEAARNEFEAVHVVINGGGGGAKAVSVAADALVGPDGARIDDVRVYREAWYTTTTASYQTSALGRWPDAMIPSVDEIDNQTRNAFPYDVPANEQQPVFVEYHVSSIAPPGWYSGVVHVTGGARADVPVKLYVHAFTLPSTATIRSAFGIGYDDPCVAHFGGYTPCGGDPGVISILNKYTRFALDHRISLSDVVATTPAASSDGSYDWSAWDAIYGPMMNGAMGGRLAGAKLTSLRYAWTVDQPHFAEWAKHFRANGWLDRTFDYTCDEPPAGCAWNSIAPRAAMVHAADSQFQVLVTTNLAQATANGLLGIVDTLVPADNWLDPMPPDTNLRATYDPWLAQSPQHRVWLYHACDSHSCDSPGGPTQSTWPSYMIDGPATLNRAFEWQSWRQRVSGELYYDTTYAFTRGDAWTNQSYFGGNGDGTLFYPGTPAKIGGTSHIPIASLRLKMIREGQEDYEYFKLLSDAGDPTMADAEAAGLSPNAYNNASDPAVIDAARHRMAARIEQLTGQTPPPMNGGGGGAGGSGGGSGTGGNGDPSGGNGDASGGSPTGAGTTAGTAHAGCSAVPGRPSSNPLSLALLAAVALVVLRRRATGR